mgnify:CR=1 FL=1
MPLPLENIPVLPNAVFASQIVLQSFVTGGDLKVVANIVLQGAVVENGVWKQATGQCASINISDVLNLDPDLASLQPQVSQLFAGLVDVIGQINSIRKVI